jgi:hypothetical protein
MMGISGIKYDKKNDLLEFESSELGWCEIDKDGDLTSEDIFTYIPISELKEIIGIYEDRKNTKR